MQHAYMRAYLLSVCLSIYLSIYLSSYLSVRRSTCLHQSINPNLLTFPSTQRIPDAQAFSLMTHRAASSISRCRRMDGACFQKARRFLTSSCLRAPIQHSGFSRVAWGSAWLPEFVLSALTHQPHLQVRTNATKLHKTTNRL